jgi:putative ABC transport system permease protein
MRLRRLLSTFRLRLQSVVRRARVERELDDEIRDHIERRVAEDVARGVAREHARQAALRAFGGVERAKEACRDARRVNVIDHTVQDLRVAARHFARAPIVTATMIGIFALGIGFSTALLLFVQSFVNGPVPGIARQESLVRIRGIDRARPGRAIGREFSYPEYREYAAQRTLFKNVAAWTSSDVVLDVGTRQANLQSGAATYVTGNYFQVLGLRQALGAGLPIDANDADPAPPLVAVISHVLWESHFDRSPDVIGRAIKVNGVTVTIVGVAPRRFAGARTGGSQMRVWLPLSTRPQVQRTPSTLTSYDDARFGVAARLQPGVRAEHTVPAVDVIAARADQQMTMTTARVAATDVVPLLGGNYFPPSGADAESSAGPVIALMFPVLILLITCTNVSALVAGLGVARRREIAVRLALGADRRRIVRQLVTETVMLAMAAGALALVVIWVLLRLFDASIPDLEIEIDWRSIAFTFSLALIAGLLFGFSPALHATRLALQEALKDSAGVVISRRLRLQSWLVVAQIAFTQPALLAMGALLLEMRADLREQSAQPYADRLLEVRFNVNPRYGALDEDRERMLVRLQERLAAVPGVEGVVRQENNDSFDVDVHPADTVAGLELASPQQVRAIAAPAGYFPLLGISFVRGRDFDMAERGQERDQRSGIDERDQRSGIGERDQRSGTNDGAVVIGSGLARRLWGGADAIGRRLVSVGPTLRGTGTFTIVGVVDDATTGAQGGGSGVVGIFMPRVHTTGHLLIRTHGPAEQLLPAIRATAADEAPALPIVAARTLAAVEASERRSVATAISAAGGTGALALLLSAIGLYAVVAFAVGQRVREIGIRTALGAESRQVVRLFLGRGLRLCICGLVMGLALGIGGVRVISAVEGNEPPTGILGLAALVAVFVIGVALLASWIPARRAARIDPLEALRVE